MFSTQKFPNSKFFPQKFTLHVLWFFYLTLQSLLLTLPSSIRLTPLDYAVRNGHGACAEELQAHGAVTVAMIREMAATCIQSVFRGFRYNYTQIQIM